MAAPTYVAAGASQAALGGTDLTVPWPAHQVGDIALLWVQRCNEAIVLSTPAGFTLIGSTSAGTAGSNNSQITNVYWCRATSTSMASPVVSNPLETVNNSYAIARITTYRGCVTTGDPFNTFGASADATANTSYSIPGGTTTVNECLIALLCAGTRDNAVSSCANDFTNADLTGIGNYENSSTAAGNGGNLNIASAVKTTAGAFGVTTGTFTAGTSQTKALMFVALKPPLAAPQITNINPAPGEDIRSSTVIGFDITDDTSLALVIILASFADETCEAVHDGDDFRGNYRNAANTREAITGGYRYTIRRSGGWHQSPTLEWFALDGSGNMGIIA